MSVVPSTPPRVPIIPSTPPRVPIVPSTPSRAPVVPSTPSRMLVVPTSATSYSDIAKSAVSPKAHGLKITLKQPSPIPDVLTTTQPPGPMGSEPTKPSTSAGPMQESQEPTAGSEEVCRSSLTAHLLADSFQGARVDALSLRLLQVSELQALFGDLEPNVSKPKRKDGALHHTFSA